MEKITSRRNPLCVHIKKLGADRGYRDSCGQFLCDGIKLLEEAVTYGAEIIAVLTASNVPFPLPVDAKVYRADRSIISSLSPLKNAQDTLFTCSVPKDNTDTDTQAYAHVTQILLDGVQDPGNVGTIIRTANAFAIGCVLLTSGCADPYNPKTIRASMGAVFRQRVRRMDLSGLKGLKAGGARFVGAATSAGEGCIDLSCAALEGAIIAIGSEGRGLSESVLMLCDETVTIPIAPECESLNAAVAAAIIMWEARRQS